MSTTQTAVKTQTQQAQQPAHSPNILDKIGGFSFIESVIDGIANMNSGRKARKQIFLTDSSKNEERKELLKKLNLWVNLLESNDSIDKMVEACKTKATSGFYRFYQPRRWMAGYKYFPLHLLLLLCRVQQSSYKS